ncbi:TetR/AcrR family transcriptional regulator [Metabacillus sp. HB246100]|uniref:TetR/AcrR family transcriptional regulator n=1 Tax=Bacillus weihaiensis TaxID=1547283 RepID=UPI002356D6BB|nr:TetR/AcrR family transcriptional regulator [Bacillus weihaiensis]
MTMESIKEAALLLFSSRGYDGTSLSQIAAAVGMKKQSIYSHFTNKDELYLSILEEAIFMEEQYVTQYVAKIEKNQLKEQLYSFLHGYRSRYETTATTRFMLTVAFSPPPHLYSEIMKQTYDYLERLERLFFSVFENDIDEIVIPSNEVAIAFTGVMDSILIELLYSGDERFQRRLEATWKIFWRGITVSKED